MMRYLLHLHVPVYAPYGDEEADEREEVATCVTPRKRWKIDKRGKRVSYPMMSVMPQSLHIYR
jgi:hypothetical protein